MRKKIILGVIGISAAAILMGISITYRNQHAKLAQAALDGKPAEVERLLADGIEVNGRAADGFTALMAASNKGHTEVVRKLLDAGADVNLASDNGGTALMDVVLERSPGRCQAAPGQRGRG